MIQLAWYAVVGIYVSAKTISAMATHKEVARAAKDDPSMLWCATEAEMILTKEEAQKLDSLSSEERNKVVARGMDRYAIYMKKAKAA